MEETEDSDVSATGVTVTKNTGDPHAPLSEVGYLPTSGHPGTSDVNNDVMLVTQGMSAEFFTQMMQMMKQMSERLTKPNSGDKVKINDIFLPSYDPDTNVGVREWCQHITQAVELYKLNDYEIRMKVGSLLKGRAKFWVDSWLVTTTSWEELKNNLITTFEPENRYSRDITKFRDHSYDPTKDIAEFLSKAWVLWKRVTKEKLGDDDAVEAVIGCVDDEHLRIELLNARAKSVPELISVATSRRAKRPHQGTSQTMPGKRPRYDDKRLLHFCQVCKKNGHIARECSFRVVDNPTSNRDGKETSRDTREAPRDGREMSRDGKDRPTCTFCSKVGHTFENCFKRNRSVVSNVNCVGSSKSKIKVMIGNVICNAMFDSGAECSVVRESVAAKLPGRRIDKVTYLRGIGQFPVISLQALIVVCEIDEVNIELEFFVVADYEMTLDVLIGMDLIEKTGFDVLVTAGGAKVVRRCVQARIQSNHAIFENLDCDLTEESEINELRILLNKYAHLFIRGFPSTRVKTGQLEIRLKDPTKYVERRPYRLSPVEREKVRDIVQELLDHNIIRESKSPFSSPIILVKKKNGDDRMCVDYRELNSNTLRDHYPLPLISDQIDQLSGGVLYNSLDMAAGFHQIPVESSSIERTAFVTPDGLFEYLTMPFGLSNASAVYQRCINKALSPLLGNDGVAQVYVDDVLSKCSDVSQGMTYLERIFIALQEAGFSINVEKSAFFKKSIEYLGNIISHGEVRPSPRKVEALVKAAIPTNVKQVRQFNGLAGYFRRFIPNFSRIMIPLYELTKQGAKWEWNERHEEARNIIIQYLTSSPVLTIFQEDAAIELYTDASSLGFGAVLIQIIGERRHAVAYMSQRTTEVESRYHSYELETLAVVRAIKHFRQYLYGRKFKLITDCNALKASQSKKELLPRVYRWWAFLQQYEFEVEYRKGERLQHADFFSRNPPTMEVNIMTRDLDWLKVEQRRDATLRAIIDGLANDQQSDGYVLEDGVLKKVLQHSVFGEQKLIVVPKAFQWSLINSFHTALKHTGWEKTLDKVKEAYWFEKMNTVVRIFVENCVVCRTSKGKSGAVQAELHPIQKPSAVFQVVHMDITGKLGTTGEHDYVIVTIDAFTKYVMLYHATNKNPHSTLAALKRGVYLFGTPVQIIVDGGREFLGEFKAYCEQFGIEIHAISPGVSRANGQVERMMGTLKNALVMIKNYETEQWHTTLDELQLAFNCTAHRVTGVAPLTLLTRRRNCVPPELLNLVNIDEQTVDIDRLVQHVQQRMTVASQQDKQRFDKGKAVIRPFQRGDYVLIKNNPRNQTCLDLKFSEPYEVSRVLDNDRYLVKKVVGRGRPRKVAHDQLRRAPQPGEQQTVSAEADAEDAAVGLAQANDEAHDVTPASPDATTPTPSTSRGQ